MARRSTKSTVAEAPADLQTSTAGQREPASAEATSALSQSLKPVRPDTADLDIEALAKAILAREIKPRVGEIRRLAEALLRKKDRKRAKKARKAESNGDRKLSKIPARKRKK